MAQGSSDLTEALRSSHRDHFPRKLMHLCFWSSVTVSSAVPGQTFAGSAEGGHPARAWGRPDSLYIGAVV